MSDIRSWQRPPTWPRPGIGHNGGPPLDDEPPGKLLFVKYRWKKAHAAAWKGASREITLFRLRRAEAAGVTYEEYMRTLLDTGRHLQREDVVRARALEGSSTQPQPSGAQAKSASSPQRSGDETDKE